MLLSQRFTFEPVGEPGLIARDAMGVQLAQQVDVPQGYRLDFVLTHARSPVRIAVELDGHRYHDATPEAAERDKSRDRVLTGAGWRVLRFTGREIVRSVSRYADEAHGILVELASPKTPVRRRTEQELSAELSEIAAMNTNDLSWEEQVCIAAHAQAVARERIGIYPWNVEPR
jgi:very-short-patch-repair endonuclease